MSSIGSNNIKKSSPSSSKKKKVIKRSAKPRPKGSSVRKNPTLSAPAQVLADASNRVKDGCLPSSTTTIKLVFGASWYYVLQMIDKFLAAAQVEKPNLFLRPQTFASPTYVGTQSPEIPFVIARSCYLMAAMEYFVRLRMIPTLSLQNVQVIPGIKLPVGLAKYLQQFAPYVDTTTGSTVRFEFPPLPSDTMKVYTNYPDISQAISVFDPSLLTNLNAETGTYLIHPSQYVSASVTHLDFVTVANHNNPSYPIDTTTNVILLDDLVPTITTLQKEAVNKLFVGVAPGDIDNYSPDASFYTQVTNRGITCPFPDFDACIAMIGPGYVGDTANTDFGVSYPFIAGIPAIGYRKSLGSYVNLDDKRALLMQTFATLLGNCIRYCGPCTSVGSLKETVCFGKINSLEVMGVQVSPVMVVERLAQYVASLSNNNAEALGVVNPLSTSPTNLFGLTTTYWQAVLRRVAIWDQMVDRNNMYGGYAQGGASMNARFPDMLSHVVSGIGPVIIKGKLYIPYFASHPLHWADVIDGTGKWNMVSNSLATITNGKCGYSVYSGSSVDLTIFTDQHQAYIPPSGLQTTMGPITLSEWFNEAMKQLPGENWSLASPLAKTCFGSPTRVFGGSVVSVQIGTYGDTDSLITQYERQFRLTFSNANSAICSTHVDAADFGVCGLISNLPLTNPTGNIKAQAVQFRLSPNNQVKNLSIQISGSNSSTFTGTLQAIQQSKSKSKGKPALGLSVKDPTNQKDDVYSLKQPYIYELLAQAADQIFDRDGDSYTVTPLFRDFLGFAFPGSKQYIPTTPTKVSKVAADTKTYFTRRIVDITGQAANSYLQSLGLGAIGAGALSEIIRYGQYVNRFD